MVVIWGWQSMTVGLSILWHRLYSKRWRHGTTLKSSEKYYIRYFDTIIFGLKDYHSNDDHLRLSRRCLPCGLSAVCFWSCEVALALVCSCVQPFVEVTICTHKQEQSRNLTFIYLPGLTEVIPFRLHIRFPKWSPHPNCV